MKKAVILISASLIIILLLWLIFFRGKDNPRDYEEIESSGAINIVTDYNPVGYFVSGDSLTGFNHDVIELLGSQIPFKIRVSLESNLDKSIEGLNTGKYDIIVRNIPITSELRSSLVFAQPIIQNRQVLIQRKKEFNDNTEPIRSHLNLAKKTLYVSAGSPAILRIRNLSHEIGDTIYVKEDDFYSSEQLAMQVAAGDIDYAVCDEKVAIEIAKTLPEIDYTTLIGFTHLEAWAVSDQSPILLDSLNSWINRMKETDKYKSIYQRYYK